MSIESERSAVDRASTPAVDSTTNMAALIHSTVRSTDRCWSATSRTSQHSCTRFTIVQPGGLRQRRVLDPAATMPARRSARGSRGVRGRAFLTAPAACATTRPDDGLHVLAGRGGLPRRAAGMARARAPRSPRGVARHRRRVHPPPRPVVRRVPGVAQAAPSRRVGRDRLAPDVRRAGREPGRPDDLPGGDGAGGGAARCEHHRPHAGGPRDHGVGDRGAAAPLPARDPRRRRHLVPGLLGARGGIRSRRARHARGPGRRHLPRLGPEGLDVERPPEPVVHPARPHGPGARRSTTASRASSWTCGARASPSGRWCSSPATRSSTRSSSRTCACPGITSSARSTAAGRSASRS